MPGPTEVLQFTVLGLGAGALYALAAVGVVLTYRASGILNFAQGAMGMAGAMIFYDLWLEFQLPWYVACLGGIAVGAGLGIAAHVLVMRPLRHVSGLTKLIATLGIFTALEFGFAARYGLSLRLVPPLIPRGIAEPIPDVPIATDRLVLFLLAVSLTLVLAAVYRYTRFGVTTTAIAENQQAVAALGRSPDLIAATNWGIAGGLAALAAILIVSVVGLDVVGLSLLIIPALAAALIGRFASFLLTFLSGLALGVMEAQITSFVPVHSLSASVPFVAIVLVLVVRGRALPVRGEVLARLPGLSAGVLRPPRLAAAVALMLAAIWLVPVAWVDAVTTSLLFAVVLLSIVVLTGFAGQLSLAQYTLAGMGAWIAASLVAFHRVPFEAAFVLGVLGAVAIGLVIGLPALRTRGVNLAIATLGLALLLQNTVLFNLDVTGGPNGTIVGDTHLFGLDVSSVAHPRRFALVVFAAFLVLSLIVLNLRRSEAGRRVIAVRSNERAAAALGIDVAGAKLYAFALSAALAGVGGILAAFRFPYANFTSFSVLASINAVVAAVIGGVGYVIGPLFGSLLAPGGLGFQPFADLPDVLHVLQTVSGLLLVTMLIANPNGLAETHNVGFLLHRVGLPRRTSAPAVTAALPAVSVERAAPAALTVTNLSVRFGGVVALNRVSLTVRPGEIAGLIGPNGAGKSTLIDAVTGFATPAEGDIRLNGDSLLSYPPHKRARSGVSRLFQSLELFEDMTVADNLRVASLVPRPTMYVSELVWPRPQPLTATAIAAVKEFNLEDALERRPNGLSYGRRRLVGIARAVASRPSILLLDEPAAGLDETHCEELSTLIRRLARDWGIGILLVEHDVDMVLRVCDYVTVVDFGRTIAAGRPSEIATDRAVIAAYLGEVEKEGEIVDASLELTAAPPQ